MLIRHTVRSIGIAALLGTAAVTVYAQPASIASDAALVVKPPKAAPAPIPADVALPNAVAPTAPPSNVVIAPAADPDDRSNVVIAPALPAGDAAAPQVTAPEAVAPPAPVGEPVPAADASAVEAPQVMDESVPSTPLSFDDFGASVFYKPQDISKLKTALDIADALARKAAQGVTKIEEAIMPAMPEPPKIEITEYPVFHLSSIMYQGAGKWVLWLNGNRTTSKNLPPDLQVVGINTHNARFEWKPQIYPALESRWKSEEGNAAKTNLKKLLSGANLVSVDEKSGVIRFTLRPNQSYASAYNAVMEGKQLPVGVQGDSGVIDVGAFEQTLRENEMRNRDQEPSSATRGANNRMPRVVRPGNAGTSAMPGAPVLGSTAPRSQQQEQPAKRRSGLVTPDTATIGLVPSIFPGGVPAAAEQQQVVPRIPRMPSAPVAPDAGLPILPPGAQ